MKKYLLLIFLSLLLLSGCWTTATEYKDKSKAVVSAELNWLQVVDVLWPSLIWCGGGDSIFTSKKLLVKKEWKQFIVRVCCWLIFKWCTIRY